MSYPVLECHSLISEGNPLRVEAEGRSYRATRLFATEGFGYSRIPVSYVNVWPESSSELTLYSAEEIASVEVSPRGAATVRLLGTRLAIEDYRSKFGVRINEGEWCFVFVDPPVQSLVDTEIALNDYGADRSGRIPATKELQQAINDAGRLGSPATVRVLPGLYLTGSLWMRDNVTLYLEEGAVLLGELSSAAYPPVFYRGLPEFHPDTDPQTYRSLIWFDRVKNAGIRGRGVLDGQGCLRRDQWRSDPDAKRPQTNILRIVDSEDIFIEGIVLQDSEFWAVHPLRSSRVTLSNLKILNEMVYPGWDITNPRSTWNNTDGINPDSCSDVLVEDCFIYTGDDSLVLKTTNSSPDRTFSCEDITLRRCLLAASTCAIKFGTESVGPAIREVRFEEITILSMSSGRNIVFVAKDCSELSDIHFESIVIESQARWLGMEISERYAGQQKVSRLARIQFWDIVLPAGASGYVRGHSKHAEITDITFTDISIGGALASRLEDLGLEISYADNLRLDL